MFATLTACKSNQLVTIPTPTETPENTSTIYPPYDWEFSIPEGWVAMSEERIASLTNRGKKLIAEKGGPGANAVEEGEGTILALEHSRETALFINTLTSRPDSIALPYHLSRLRRFDFYKKSLSRWDLETKHERGGAYLGDMYFEALYLRAESKASGKVLSQQAIFETQRDDQVLALIMVANDEAVYDEMVKALLQSSFSSSEDEIPKKWQELKTSSYQLRIPEGLERTTSDKENVIKYLDPNAPARFSVEINKKATSATMENMEVRDNPAFFAKLALGLDKVSSAGLMDETPPEETFISGKRCFSGSYKLKQKGFDLHRHFIYVAGRNSDFEIRYDYNGDPEEGMKIARQIVASLEEK